MLNHTSDAISTSVNLQSKADTRHKVDQMAKPNYRPDIDGLRAIAVLSVVLYHAAPGRLPAGFIGVDIFFVISGFLISSILIKSLRNDRFSLIDFYSRRIKRIFPALLVVLTSCLGICFLLLTDNELKELSKHIAAGAGFVTNIVLWTESGYFDQSADFKPMLHLWSLGIEEQFYILWPLLLWMAWRLRCGVIALTTMLAVISFVLNVWQIQADAEATFYLPFTRFWELLIGALLAASMLRTDAPVIGRPQATFTSAVGVALIAASFLLIDKSRAFPGWWALLPTTGSALLILAGPQSWINRVVLSNRLLVWFGLISFPLYLWHWPLLSFLRIFEGTEIAQWKRVAVIAVAIVLAWLTHELVEKSVRYRRSGWITLGLTIAMASIGLVGVAGYFSNGFQGRTMAPRVVNAGEIDHLPFFEHIRANYFSCTETEIAKTAGVWNGYVRCFQSQSGQHHDIVLLGDSHAEHLFPGLAAQMPRSNLVFYGSGGLPFHDNANFNRIFETLLTDSHIKRVIVSANWFENLQAFPAHEWQEKLTKTIKLLTNSGKKVYLIEDVPRFSFSPSRCKYVGRFGSSNLCGEADQHFSSTYMSSFHSLASSNPDLSIIQIHPLFCGHGQCTMALHGNLYYRDDNHLNVSGSNFVAGSIVTQMEGK
jgi:peptidoglycan/LPS O-acetylase OafA/YrhL